MRTPQEALLGRPSTSSDKQEEVIEEENEVGEEFEEVEGRPSSRPLPPLPGNEAVDFGDEETLVSTPSCPTRAVPPTPIEEEPETPSTASPASFKSHSSLKVLAQFPPVPALPANLPPSPPQAPFDPILLSPGPSGAIDRSKIIVSLETSTVTYKAAFNTLTSRPSFLSAYLQSLVRSQEEEPQSALPRDSQSSFNSIFQKHLASSGLLSSNMMTIHLFLDRPSGP